MINDEYEKEQALEQRISTLEKRTEKLIKCVGRISMIVTKLTGTVVIATEKLEGENNAPTDPAA